MVISLGHTLASPVTGPSGVMIGMRNELVDEQKVVAHPSTDKWISPSGPSCQMTSIKSSVSVPPLMIVPFQDIDQ